MKKRTKTKKELTPMQKANRSMREFIKYSAVKALAAEKQKLAKEAIIGFAKDNSDLLRDGNIILKGGYVHFGNETVIVPCDGFNFSQFMIDFPELIDKEFKIAPMKALLKDEAGRAKLQNHCVELKEKTKIDVIIDKKS